LPEKANNNKYVFPDRICYSSTAQNRRYADEWYTAVKEKSRSTAALLIIAGIFYNMGNGFEE